jgi:hypothetical protein
LPRGKFRRRLRPAVLRPQQRERHED